MAKAASLVRSSREDKTAAQIARELDLTDRALRNFVERAEHASGSDLSQSEHMRDPLC